MSSLRLALKQSLAESAQIRLQAQQRDRERRREADRRRRQKRAAREAAAREAAAAARRNGHHDHPHNNGHAHHHRGSSPGRDDADDEGSSSEDDDDDDDDDTSSSDGSTSATESSSSSEDDDDSSGSGSSSDSSSDDDDDESDSSSGGSVDGGRPRKRGGGGDDASTSSEETEMRFEDDLSITNLSGSGLAPTTPKGGKKKRKDRRRDRDRAHDRPSGSIEFHSGPTNGTHNESEDRRKNNDRGEGTNDGDDGHRADPGGPDGSSVPAPGRSDDFARPHPHPDGDDDGAAAASAAKKKLKKKKKKKRRDKPPSTVPPPTADVLSHVRSMSESRQRRYIREGYRVKVQFDVAAGGGGGGGGGDGGNPPSSTGGGGGKRLRWYGGSVTRVLDRGSRVRIAYDDGSSEMADFPDKDIVVDAEENGRHRTINGRDRNNHDANPFVPPPPSPPSSPSSSRSPSPQPRPQPLPQRQQQPKPEQREQKPKPPSPPTQQQQQEETGSKPAADKEDKHNGHASKKGKKERSRDEKEKRSKEKRSRPEKRSREEKQTSKTTKATPTAKGRGVSDGGDRDTDAPATVGGAVEDDGCCGASSSHSHLADRSESAYSASTAASRHGTPHHRRQRQQEEEVGAGGGHHPHHRRTDSGTSITSHTRTNSGSFTLAACDSEAIATAAAAAAGHADDDPPPTEVRSRQHPEYVSLYSARSRDEATDEVRKPADAAVVLPSASAPTSAPKHREGHSDRVDRGVDRPASRDGTELAKPDGPVASGRKSPQKEAGGGHTSSSPSPCDEERGGPRPGVDGGARPSASSRPGEGKARDAIGGDGGEDREATEWRSRKGQPTVEDAVGSGGGSGVAAGTEVGGQRRPQGPSSTSSSTRSDGEHHPTSSSRISLRQQAGESSGVDGGGSDQSSRPPRDSGTTRGNGPAVDSPGPSRGEGEGPASEASVASSKKPRIVGHVVAAEKGAGVDIPAAPRPAASEKHAELEREPRRSSLPEAKGTNVSPPPAPHRPRKVSLTLRIRQPSPKPSSGQANQVVEPTKAETKISATGLSSLPKGGVVSSKDDVSRSSDGGGEAASRDKGVDALSPRFGPNHGDPCREDAGKDVSKESTTTAGGFIEPELGGGPNNRSTARSPSPLVRADDASKPRKRPRSASPRDDGRGPPPPKRERSTNDDSGTTEEPERRFKPIVGATAAGSSAAEPTESGTKQKMDPRRASSPKTEAGTKVSDFITQKSRSMKKKKRKLQGSRASSPPPPDDGMAKKPNEVKASSPLPSQNESRGRSRSVSPTTPGRLSDGEYDALTYRSSRRAAQKANERIVARKDVVVDAYNPNGEVLSTSKKQQDGEDQQQKKSSAASTPSRREDGVPAEDKVKDEEAGDAEKKASHTDQADDREEDEEEDSSSAEDVEEDENWVQCDRCMKWRLLPSSSVISTEDLPDRWYCELNVFDRKRNFCEAPEQTAEDVLKEREAERRRVAARTAGTTTGNKRRRSPAEKMAERAPADRSSHDGLSPARQLGIATDIDGASGPRSASPKVSPQSTGKQSIKNRTSAEVVVEQQHALALPDIPNIGNDDAPVTTEGTLTTKPVGDDSELPGQKNARASSDSSSVGGKDEVRSDTKNTSLASSNFVPPATQEEQDQMCSVVVQAGGEPDADRRPKKLQKGTPSSTSKDRKISEKEALEADASSQASAQSIAKVESTSTGDAAGHDGESGNDSSSLVNAATKKGSNRNRNSRKRDRETLSSGDQKSGHGSGPGAAKASSSSSSSKGGSKSGKEKGALEENQQEWVQCEKCDKWRRLPPRIRAADLPDVWYCSMNTWDTRSANCSAPEDKYQIDSQGREYTILGDNAAVVGRGANVTSSKPGSGSNGSKLSYRNLIFGNGRKLSRPASERARAAESIFVAPCEDGPVEGNENTGEKSTPTVLYANSSAFIPRGQNSRCDSDGATSGRPNISFLELMSKSRLWKDLSRVGCLDPAYATGSQRLNGEHAGSVGGSEISCFGTFDSTEGSTATQDATKMSDNMKALVYHALLGGSRYSTSSSSNLPPSAPSLAAHEVLLEAQCRDWNGAENGEISRGEWAELRATCTIEGINHSLDELVQDGLVEVVQDTRKSPLYRRFRRIDPSSTSSINNANTRCIKIVKPWKAAVSLGKRCRWSDAEECEELLQRAQRRYNFLNKHLGPDPSVV